MHADMFDHDEKTRASVGKPCGWIPLTFYNSRDINSVTIFLPLKMEACAHMIVEAFNAHMSEETIADAVTDISAERVNMLDLDAFTLGGTIDYDAATAVEGAMNRLDIP